MGARLYFVIKSTFQIIDGQPPSSGAFNEMLIALQSRKCVVAGASSSGGIVRASGVKQPFDIDRNTSFLTSVYELMPMA